MVGVAGTSDMVFMASDRKGGPERWVDLRALPLRLRSQELHHVLREPVARHVLAVSGPAFGVLFYRSSNLFYLVKEGGNGR